MSILSSTYIFYADIYLVQNFMIKVVVIYLTLYCNKLQSYISTMEGIIKISLVSFLGSIIEVIMLLFGSSYQLFIVLVQVLEVPIVFYCVVAKMRQTSFSLIISGYFWVVVVNGMLEIFWNWFGENGSYMFYLMFVCGFVIVVVRIWIIYAKQQKGIFLVAAAVCFCCCRPDPALDRYRSFDKISA